MVSSKSRQKQKRNIKHDGAYRVNFLYQAAHMALSQFPDNPEISRFYMSSMKQVSQKVTVKMNPWIKRSMCKRCDVTLVPGITSKVRVRGKRETHVVVKCLECGCLKRFNARKKHILWSDKLQDSIPDHNKQNTSQQQQQQMKNAKQKESSGTGSTLLEVTSASIFKHQPKM